MKEEVIKNDSKTRICKKCGIEHPLTKKYFQKVKTSYISRNNVRKSSLKKGSKRSYHCFLRKCKICNSKYRKKWIQDNYESHRISVRKWAKEHKEFLEKYLVEYNKSTRDKRLKTMKEYYFDNRDHFLENRKSYRAESDVYIITLLKRSIAKTYGIDISNIPKELIEMEKEYVKLYRMRKQFLTK